MHECTRSVRDTSELTRQRSPDIGFDSITTPGVKADCLEREDIVIRVGRLPNEPPVAVDTRATLDTPRRFGLSPPFQAPASKIGALPILKIPIDDKGGVAGKRHRQANPKGNSDNVSH